MKRVTIGMLAPVDSGKTTLAEAILYKTGTIRAAGRVDHGDAYLDTDSIEKERGITIFSKQALCKWDDVDAAILDTPGHVDFAAEMERTLSVLDYAVLILSASDGVRPHAVTLWNLLKKNDIPVFVFVNKMDLSVHKRQDIQELLKEKLSEKCVDFTGDHSADEHEAFRDDISLISEKACEEILSGSDAKLDRVISEEIRDREIFPVYYGAALKFEGVDDLLSGLSKYIVSYPVINSIGAAEPSGKVFKISYDDRERLTYVKITKGVLSPRSLVRINHRSGGSEEEKVQEIRFYSGEKYRQGDKAEPGQIAALTGITCAVPGDSVGSEEPSQEEELQPYMTYNVIPEDPADTHVLLEAVRALCDEDPKLSASWDPESKSIVVRIMGSVQLEVLRQVIKTRFGLDCSFGDNRIIYRETIKRQVEGVGHFEPLRHYAEVHLIITPADPGSGITIRTECPLESLDINWQNLVMSHLMERDLRGVLTGSVLTDVDICLAQGRASKKHTEGGDFREATFRALRQGLMQARETGDAVLLEPWLRFTIESSQQDVGLIMTDIQNLGGVFTGPGEKGTADESVILEGKAPAASLQNYQARLAGLTHGRASFSAVMCGYDKCHDAEKIIEESCYAPEHDVDDPADSVFCSHGSGDIVKWNEVFDHMHIGSVLEAREKKNESSADGYSDELLANEALNEERKRRYRKALATDKELMAIFERTYGPVKDQKIQRQNGFDDWEPEEKSRKDTNHPPKTPKQQTQGEIVTHLFVDGYNLIHAWPELKELSEVDFGSARDKLTDIVCNYAGFTGYDTVLVFDAYKVTEGIGASMNIHGIKVVYTKEHETADSYIERETLNLMKRIKAGRGTGRDKERIMVVTSDNLEQIVSMGHGALRISSREFVEEVARVDEIIRNI